jgi:hypothetical protein
MKRPICLTSPGLRKRQKRLLQQKLEKPQVSSSYMLSLGSFGEIQPKVVETGQQQETELNRVEQLSVKPNTSRQLEFEDGENFKTILGYY